MILIMNLGLMNDIWQFSAISSQWSWLHGNYTAGNKSPARGTRGISNPLNVPGGVWGHSADVAYGTDKLWVFGGTISTFVGGFSNELWMFEMQVKQWTYISAAQDAGVYTTGLYYPGSRFFHEFLAIPGTPLFAMVIHVYRFGVDSCYRCADEASGRLDMPTA